MLCLSVGVALLCSFLLGFGDSCFNTQLLSIIGFMFRDDSAPAFAASKFIQVSFQLKQEVVNSSFPSRFIHSVLQIDSYSCVCSPSWPPWPSSTVTT